MYRIFADDTLIYDSTFDDYKIGKGVISLEINKSGSFVFSLYPDHFYYDHFVKLKTVITVYKSGRIVFRGRVLHDVTDYHNCKSITCEGELGFLQDSIIRPYTFTGTPGALLSKLINEHNSQVDTFKQFRVGTVTVSDSSAKIERSNADYGTAMVNVNGQFPESTLGGYIYITHGENGDDPIPTINYCSDFSKIASQIVEFGSNLKNYTKTVKADNIATAIIPLGAELSNVDGKERLTIADANNGVDYVYSAEGVALYGWIFKTVTFDGVVLADELKAKAEAYAKTMFAQNITIELTVIDLHIIDPTIEPFCICDHVRAVSKPHGFDAALLCNKQTLDLLKPENDTLSLGYATTTLTREMSSSIRAIQRKAANISTEIDVKVGEIRTVVTQETAAVRQELNDATVLLFDEIELTASEVVQTASELRSEMSSVTTQISNLDNTVSNFDTRITTAESAVTQTATELRSEMSAVSSEIVSLEGDISDLDTKVSGFESSITQTANRISAIVDSVGSNGSVTAASIVAAINKAGSSVKISADHVSVSGFVTFSDLSASGSTVINGDNISTGTIYGITIEGTEIIGSTIEGTEIIGGTIRTSGNSYDEITIADNKIKTDTFGIYSLSGFATYIASNALLALSGTPNVQIYVGSSSQYYWEFTTSAINLRNRSGTLVRSL